MIGLLSCHASLMTRFHEPDENVLGVIIGTAAGYIQDAGW
jgi:hypothetical protein